MFTPKSTTTPTQIEPQSPKSESELELFVQQMHYNTTGSFMIFPDLSMDYHRMEQAPRFTIGQSNSSEPMSK